MLRLVSAFKFPPQDDFLFLGEALADHIDKTIVVLEAARVLLDVELLGDGRLFSELELKYQDTLAQLDALEKSVNVDGALQHTQLH